MKLKQGSECQQSRGEGIAMMIEIKNISGKVIYSSEAVDICECLKNAIRDMANLSGANLSRANLSRANLSWANLSGANLSRSDLSRADLSWSDLSRSDLSRADLSWADLSWSDLSGANLSWANLSGANLSGANLSRDIKIQKQPIQVATPQYYVFIFDGQMKIGCEFHSLAEWWEFDDSQIVKLDGKKALTFWRKWKSALQAICAAEERA